MLAKYAVAVVQDGITPYGKCKTSDLLRQNIRTFASKVRHFYAKKSDVLVFPGVKRPEKPHESPNASILRYFGASPDVVASDGLLGPLTTPL